MPTLSCRPTTAPLARSAGRLVTSLCVALVCAATPLWAQASAGPSVDTTPGPGVPSVESLVLRLEQLEAEVRALRAQLDAARVGTPAEVATVAPDAAAPAGPDQAPAHAHAGGDTTAAPDAGWRAPVTQIHWFSDVGFTVTNRANATNSFGLGQLDLFLTSKLNDRWSVLSEIVFRANTDNRFVVNAERLLVQYEPTEGVQIGAGRFHSAVGYYNAAYHHGSWFETAATRPSLFGAGLVPFHNVGVSARAQLPSGPAGLEVVAELGNGLTSGSRALEPTQNVLDENNNKATNLAVVTRPTGLPGFQAGFSWYRDRLHPIGQVPLNAQTAAAHAVYNGHGWELLNEVVVARHLPDDLADARVSSGWYTQSAYRIGQVRPYVRYQMVQGHVGDSVFGALGHRYGPVVGTRVELGRFAAVKFQLDRSHQSATDTTSLDGVVKLAFTF